MYRLYLSTESSTFTGNLFRAESCEVPDKTNLSRAESCEVSDESRKIRADSRELAPKVASFASGSTKAVKVRRSTDAHYETCFIRNENSMIPRMHRATPFLATRDMRATVDFYTRLLGFVVVARKPDTDPTFVTMDNGAASITFDSTLWPGEPAMTGQIHFDLGPSPTKSSAVLALLDRLGQHAKVLWGPEVYSYGRREFSCADPNGYALVFSEPTDDAPTCND